MLKFLKQALSERGEPSIKRLTLAWALILFTAELIVNACGKQRVLDATLQSQLYELILISLGAVLGINVLNGIKDIKFKQSDNNKSVGSPSPTPDTTVITTEKPAA